MTNRARPMTSPNYAIPRYCLFSPSNYFQIEQHKVLLHVELYNNQINARALIGQSAMGYNLVPRLSLLCLPLSLGERPWLRLVT